MIHAILMTVYKDVQLVNRLIASYPSNFRLYIHIDKKSSIHIDEICKRDNLYVCKLFRVNWGGYNHVLAMVHLLGRALDDNCDYYHWVTGQDAPLFPETFDQRLKVGYSYLESFKIPNSRWCSGTFYEGGLYRYQIYGLYDLFDAKNAFQNKWIQRIERWQKHYNFIRPFRNYDKLYGGSGYFSLYKIDAILLYEKFPNWKKFYKNTFCAEESIIQTILMNSDRKDYIINNNLRYIDWNADIPPKILTVDDYKYIKMKYFLFCRKVDIAKSQKLLKIIGI